MVCDGPGLGRQHHPQRYNNGVIEYIYLNISCSALRETEGQTGRPPFEISKNCEISSKGIQV